MEKFTHFSFAGGGDEEHQIVDQNVLVRAEVVTYSIPLLSHLLTLVKAPGLAEVKNE